MKLSSTGSVPSDHRVNVGFALAFGCVLFACITGVVLMVNSFQWRFANDLPVMLYASWMLDRGATLYRDIFDVNMPGTYFTMWAIGKLTGWSDVGIRLVDLIGLGILSTLTYVWLRPYGRMSQACAIALFAVLYIGGGHNPFTMQREALILIPFAGALVLTTERIRLKPTVRNMILGILAGFASTIKPQLILLFIPVLWEAALTDRAAGVWKRHVI
jgi:hypothetical protein